MRTHGTRSRPIASPPRCPLHRRHLAVRETEFCRLKLDPLYVDLIARRYEAATGVAATLAGTGETFEALAARRARETAPVWGPDPAARLRKYSEVLSLAQNGQGPSEFGSQTAIALAELRRFLSTRKLVSLPGQAPALDAAADAIGLLGGDECRARTEERVDERGCKSRESR
jgi:hypothetical protein